MAGSLKTNSVQLGDSAVDSHNFLLRTNADGTAKLARGANGDLGDILTVDANGSAKITGAMQLAQILHTRPGTVATGTTLIPLDNTIPQITEGTEFMTLAITPKDAASLLEITVVVQGSASSITSLIASLFQDATANALCALHTLIGTINTSSTITMVHVMPAGTTSATTFRVRAGTNVAGTLTFNGGSGAQLLGGVNASSITIKEYLP
jgi:hypothetical protein